MQVSSVISAIVEKDVPAIDVIGVRARVPVDEIGRLVQEAASRLCGAPAGRPLAIYYDTVFDPRSVDVEVVYPVAAGADQTLLPVHVVSLIHHGPYASIHETYAALYAWVGEYGRRQFGPVREVYLSGPGESPATEVQVPLMP